MKKILFYNRLTREQKEKLYKYNKVILDVGFENKNLTLKEVSKQILRELNLLMKYHKRNYIYVIVNFKDRIDFFSDYHKYTAYKIINNFDELIKCIEEELNV